MARVTSSVTSHKRHKKILKLTKGYRGTKSRLFKVAKEASLHAGQYAYHGRKLRKRDMRRLWITRINGALSEHNLSYSKFMHRLKQAKIALDRKVLAELAYYNPETFKQIVEKVQASRQQSQDAKK